MKRLICIIIGVCLVFLTSYVSAFTFTYEYRGQTLEYTFVTGKTCQVAAGSYIKGGNQISGDLYIPSHVVYNGKELTVVSIGEYAFYQNSNLVSVEIPNTVTSIGDSAFERCKSLYWVDLSYEIKNLGSWCFAFCSQLTKISLPETLISMGDHCFWYCSNLQSITLPSCLSQISDNCFGQCSILDHIIIPQNIKKLGNESFYGCSSLSNIKLPENLISLGESCFKSCSNLKKIIIPGNVESIGNECFAYTGLESIELPSSIYSIGFQCFYMCKNLKKASVRASNIGTYCFFGCNLESLYIDGNLCYSQNEYQNITTDTLIIGPNIHRLLLGTYVMPRGAASTRYERLLMESPKKIIIEDSDQELEIGWINDSSGSNFQSVYNRNSPGTFHWASEVSDLYLGRTLIGCEMDTSSIEFITLGSQLNTFSLGTQLSNLSALEKLKYLSSLNCTPPIIGNVSTEQYQNIKVEVPTESLASYKKNPVWNKFTNLMVDIPASIDGIIADGNTDYPTEIYDFKGIKVENCINNLSTGIYIVRAGKVVKKIIVK